MGAAWRQTEDLDERKAYRELIQRSIESLRCLAEIALVNFAHRLSLLEAVLLSVDGEELGALAKFQVAISQAGEGNWVSDVARCQRTLGALSLRR
ncbi:MAG: hypothetical protein HRU17_10395 [Polyangiaceae bacterium]|nr:hypothetical protein [Polyangiaceae bacterium]